MPSTCPCNSQAAPRCDWSAGTEDRRYKAVKETTISLEGRSLDESGLATLKMKKNSAIECVMVMLRCFDRCEVNMPGYSTMHLSLTGLSYESDDGKRRDDLLRIALCTKSVLIQGIAYESQDVNEGYIAKGQQQRQTSATCHVSLLMIFRLSASSVREAFDAIPDSLPA